MRAEVVMMQSRNFPSLCGCSRHSVASVVSQSNIVKYMMEEEACKEGSFAEVYEILVPNTRCCPSAEC